jgi:hypothetical protein
MRGKPDAVKQLKHLDESRRQFIGGSNARIIIGQDEKALIRLWQEKRGEVGPEDLSANLIVQLGLVTEDLNRAWYERNTGHAITVVEPRSSCEQRRREPRYGSDLFLLAFRKRTPAPPPFSSMNSIPAASIASLSRTRASSDTFGPKPPSRRLTVGSERPAREASSV